MPRSVEEWIGKTDDATIPPRVRLRVWDKFNGVCQCGCGRKIAAGESWELDHIKALINGGEPRESNFQPLITAHHRAKTRDDVAEKSKAARVRAKHLGIKKRTSFRGWKKFDGTAVHARRS